MYSEKSGTKASKGTVQIKVSNSRLQLVFSYAGKRKYLSLGLPDNKLNRKVAEAKAKLIESDITMERFDSSLAKYRPLSLSEPSSESPSSIPAPIEAPKPDLAWLWEKYTLFKKPQISQSTYAVDYRKYRNHIAALRTKNLENTIEIQDYLIANLTLNAARLTLTNIYACQGKRI